MIDYNILLVFPPLGNHEHPHLGLPLLKAYLRKNGYNNCTIIDYNVIIMDRITRELFANDNNLVFGDKHRNIESYYEASRQIMKGENPSDKLKSGLAMDFISRNLRIIGKYIYENISFDPISFEAVEGEYNKRGLYADNNKIYKYIREEVIPDLLQKKPSIIGFSIVFASQILYTMYICKEIKNLRPDIKIVIGGPQATIFSHAFMNSKAFNSNFDCIIKDQGEIALLSLADYWLKGKGTKQNLPNLIYKDENGFIQENRSINEKMDNIPVPDFTDLPMEKYAYPKLPFMMTRGCYWGKCAFCGYRGCIDSYIQTSKEKVIDDLHTLKNRHEIRIFHLMDDAILPKYLSGVAEEITKSGLDIIYAAFLRAEPAFNQKICNTLYKSGLRAVLFGIESANSRMLNLMEKGMDINTMKGVLETFKKSGISNYLSLIIGFPTEEKHEAYETIEFLRKNKEIYHKAYLTPFRLFSNMLDEMDRFHIYDVDIKNPVRHDKEGYVSFEYNYRCKFGLTIAEYLDILKEARKVVNSVPPGPIYFR